MNRQNPTLVGSDAWKEMEEKNPKLALKNLDLKLNPPLKNLPPPPLKNFKVNPPLKNLTIPGMPSSPKISRLN